MKVQISLEMQLYITLAGIALLFALAEAGTVSGWISRNVGGYRAMVFMDTLNENILMGNSSFSAYLPSGFCNSTANGDALSTEYGTFYTQGRVLFAGSALCPDNAYASFYIGYNSSEDALVVSR